MAPATPPVYHEERCVECGTCLSSCPVMELPLEEARAEIHSMRYGKYSRVLSRCTTCRACDFYCPNDCNPSELILRRWREYYQQNLLPQRARYFLPHSRPNFRTWMIDGMSPREKQLLVDWSDLSPASEVCYPGCNVITTPLLTQTSALRGLDIRGTLDFCCGEMYFRMGLLDRLEQVAGKTQAYFERLEAKRVTILCTAGYYMFTRVLPRFGADYEFEMESYLELLKRRLDSGEIEFKHPLNMRVTIQDSCYGKQFGDDYMDLPREVLSRAGASVVEMKNRRERMLCCGIGAGFSPYSAYNPFKMTLQAVKVMRQAKRSGASALVTYCSGCLQMFRTAGQIYRGALPVFHLLEVLGTAMGETTIASDEDIGRHMLAGTIRNQGPSLLKPGRIQVPDIDQGVHGPGYLDKEA